MELVGVLGEGEGLGEWGWKVYVGDEGVGEDGVEGGGVEEEGGDIERWVAIVGCGEGWWWEDDEGWVVRGGYEG